MTLIETLNHIYGEWCSSRRTRHFEIVIPESKDFSKDIANFSKNKRFEIVIMPHSDQRVVLLGKEHGIIEIKKTWAVQNVVWREVE